MGKVKYGKIKLDPNEFDDATASIRISMMLPMTMYKALKTLSLNETHEGQYQVLIKDILEQYILKQRLSKSSIPIERIVTIEPAVKTTVLHKKNGKKMVQFGEVVAVECEDEDDSVKARQSERHSHARK